jgi:anti-sigma-K factor RskA
MKKLAIVLVAATASAFALATSANAHPLGNFTINRYSRIEPSGNRLYVLYVLDLAEIPTFQAKSRLAAEGEASYASRLARSIGRHLELTVDGRRAVLTPVRRVLAFPPGQAGLRTTRLEVVFRGPELSTTSRIGYRDANYHGRIGWKEITAQPKARARLLSTSVPSKSVSSELLAYPKNLLQSPLDVVSAWLAVEPGPSAGAPPALLPRTALEQRAGVRAVADGGFASLISRDRLTPGFVALSLLIAMFWGAAHAFSPGHGKSIVAAYLVGSRGKPRTHTIGVFALGLVTLSLSAFIVPDQLYPWLNLVSALLIVTVGVSVLRWRVREWRGRSGHDHGHSHDHGDGHGHHHHQRPRPQPASAARDRDLGRNRPVSDSARRPARRRLAPPRRLRARPDPRLQHRPCRGDDGHRPPRRHREEDVRTGRLQRSADPPPSRVQRGRGARPRPGDDRARPPPRRVDVVHEEAAAFALDAFGQDEAEAFERHLAACSDCGAALEELRFAATALAFAVAPLEPREALRPRVLDTGAQVIPLPRRRRPTLLAVAAVAALCASVLAATRPWQTGDAQIGFRRYAATEASATLLVGRSGEAMLAARRLPPPAAGTVYELWVIDGDRPQPAGLFRGSLATLTRPVPPGAVVAVSLEPAGGSPRPTGPLLLQAETT